jgi:hypothetical protein
MQAIPDNAYVSVPALGYLCGVPLAEPALRVTLTVVSAGLPDGASALFLITGSLAAESGHMVDLGTAEPVFQQLSYGPGTVRKFSVLAQWKLSPTAVERLEQIRGGHGFTLSVGVRYGLMGGTGAPDWREPHRPLRVPFPDQPDALRIDAAQWARDVLEAWQQAAAVTMVVALPQGRTTDDHRVIVGRLAEARRQLGKGEWKASIAASREGCELLRKMRPAAIHAKPQDRDLAEREAAILDGLIGLADSLFAYGSAGAHPDAHLRDIAWNRENAVLILGGTVSVAQLIFALT